MAVQAVTYSNKIGVIATLQTTMAPTTGLLRRLAAETGKNLILTEGLADGAFAAGQSGDTETHDRLIEEAAIRVAKDCNVIVLAQGSMARMEQKLAELTGKMVLSSPLTGVLGLKEYLIQKNLI